MSTTNTGPVGAPSPRAYSYYSCYYPSFASSQDRILLFRRICTALLPSIILLLQRRSRLSVQTQPRNAPEVALPPPPPNRAGAHRPGKRIQGEQGPWTGLGCMICLRHELSAVSQNILQLGYSKPAVSQDCAHMCHLAKVRTTSDFAWCNQTVSILEHISFSMSHHQISLLSCLTFSFFFSPSSPSETRPWGEGPTNAHLQKLMHQTASCSWALRRSAAAWIDLCSPYQATLSVVAVPFVCYRKSVS